MTVATSKRRSFARSEFCSRIQEIITRDDRTVGGGCIKTLRGCTATRMSLQRTFTRDIAVELCRASLRAMFKLINRAVGSPRHRGTLPQRGTQCFVSTKNNVQKRPINTSSSTLILALLQSGLGHQ